MSSNGKSRLMNGQDFHSGQYLISPNGQFCLTLQSDGHLAVYKKNKSNKPVWKSTINPQVSNVAGPFTLKMQKDNNAVVYDGKGQPIWHTGTYSAYTNYLRFLDLDDDGNFYIRDEDNSIIWTSYTAIRRFSEGKEGISVLDKGVDFHAGEYLVSPDAQVYLTMQSDGYLAIYGKDKPDEPVWKSTINPEVLNIEGPFIFKLQVDNDVVVLDGKGQVIWHTDTSGEQCDCRLLLEDTGRLVLHRRDNAGIIIWSTTEGSFLSLNADDNNRYHYWDR